MSPMSPFAWYRVFRLMPAKRNARTGKASRGCFDHFRTADYHSCKVPFAPLLIGFHAAPKRTVIP